MTATDAVSLDRNLYNFQTEVRVRLSETDAVGIVFFGNFSSYLDVGRMDYLNHLGLGLDGNVAGLPPGAVVAASVDFHSPARYNDVLVIHARIVSLGETSYTFHVFIEQKKNRALVATGRLTLVWLDDDFRPASLPDAFRAAVRDLEGDHLDGSR